MKHASDTTPILVSACLAGQRCRYDATPAPVPWVMDLVADGRGIPFCPEIAGGLPTPRPACELRRGRVTDRDGIDRTDAFMRGAEQGLELVRLARCTRAVLKARSPSCGRDRVYDGTFSGTLVPGHGLFAAMLLDAGIAVTTEEDPEGA